MRRYNVYPQNTLSKFTTKLPISLDFKNNNDGEWYVGVSKFACTKIKETAVPKAEKPKIMFINEGDKEAVSMVVVTKSLEVEIIAMLREFPILFDLIKKKKDFFDRYTTDKVYLRDIVFTSTNILILVDKHPCKVIFDTALTVREFFDMIFVQIGPQERSNVVQKLKKSIASTSSTALEEKIQKDIKKTVRVIEPEIVKLPDGWSIPNYICIYSDIVQPQIFGNVMARGMVMHPVKYQKQYDDYQNCDIVNIQYLPLEKSRITDISILMADENGEQINFKSDTFCTMVVLHFRKTI